MKATPFYKQFAFWLYIAIMGFFLAAEFVPGFITDGGHPNPAYAAAGWQKAASAVFAAVSVVVCFLWSKDTLNFSTDDRKNTNGYLVVWGLSVALSLIVAFV